MQIILGIIFISIVLAIFLNKSENVSSKTKTMLLTFMFIIIASASLYEFVFSKKEQSNRELINAYKQGKTLTCKENHIDQTKFLFEPGTMSFMAKRDNKEFIGTIYDIKDCSIKE